MKPLVTIALSIFFFATKAQIKNIFVHDTSLGPSYDTSYIKSFRDNFVLTFVTSANSNIVGTSDSLGNDYDFATNLPTSFGLGFDYKWLTLELTSSFGNLGDPKKGETEATSFSFGLTMRKLWFRNFFQHMRGYHLENPTIINPGFDPQTDNYPYRPDVTTTVYFASINYGFNYRRYSHMASLWQLERQRKSAGSFTAGLSYAYNTYSADSALVPRAFQERFENQQFVLGYIKNVVGINLGYLYTLALGNDGRFFISLALIPGLSYQHERAFYDNDLPAQTFNGAGVHAELRGSLGYNGDKWYVAASLAGYAIASAFEGQNPSSVGYGFGRLAIGYKFTLPETKSPFLKKFGL
jgi:hypothetical protein